MARGLLRLNGNQPKGELPYYLSSPPRLPLEVFSRPALWHPLSPVSHQKPLVKGLKCLQRVVYFSGELERFSSETRDSIAGFLGV